MNRWLFEKYDGVRGFWNPSKQAFYSRRGNKLPIPQDIIKAMPRDIFLDGELWCVSRSPTLSLNPNDTSIGLGGITSRAQ